MAICPACGNSFHRDEEWKRTCRPCYFAAKNATNKVTIAAEALETLRAQAANADYWQTQYRNAVRKAEQERVSNDVASIVATLLPKLLYYCHPDRNDSTTEATNVTATLLALRRVLQ